MNYDAQTLNEFHEQHTPIQAFRNICQLKKIDLAPGSDVKSWLQRFRIGDNELKNEIGLKKYDVLSTIVYDYQKLECAVIFRKNLKLKCGMIWQGRYALYYDSRKAECRELTVVDLTNDQTRFLPISTHKLPVLNAIGGDYTMVKVDDTRIFMATCDQNGDLTGFVYLLRLDLERWNCYWLNSFSLGHIRDQTRLAVDSTNPNHFAVFDEITIYGGRINYNQCRMLPTPVHHDAIWLEYRKVEGNNVLGLMYNEPDEFSDIEGGWIMGDQDITLGGHNDGSTSHKFKIKFPQPFEPSFNGVHIWSGQRLYFFDSVNDGESSSLRILDEKTQECKTTDICVKGTVTQIFVDEQKKEVVFATNEKASKGNSFHVVYRVLLK